MKTLQSFQELGFLLENKKNELSKQKVQEILSFLEISFYDEDIKKEVEHKISCIFKSDFVNNYLPPVKVDNKYFLNILKQNKEIFNRINTYGVEVNSDVENYEIIYYAVTLNDVMELYNISKDKKTSPMNELDLYLGHIDWIDTDGQKLLFAFNTNIFKCDFLNDELIFAYKGELFVCFKK